MPSVLLRGLNRVVKRLASGRRVVYWYAWKGGPRLVGEPGTAEFLASFNAAHASRKVPSNSTLAALVGKYRASPEFLRNADTTRKIWHTWLKRIEESEIAPLTWNALNDPDVRSELMEWRDTFAKTPRTADYAVQVLSRVLAYGVDRGHLKVNHLTKVASLHRANRADQIWTDDEIEAFCAHASIPVANALKLACYTGLRRADLIALTWDDVGDTVIVKPTSKSRGAQVATIPLTTEAKAVLDGIGRKAGAHVLLNSRGDPWTGDGLENRIWKAKGLAGVKKRLHDARGTFATRLRIAGLTKDQIAAVMGWEGERVERIIMRYVDQGAFVRSIGDLLSGNKS